ncbi:penicillin-binding protein 2 [Caldanaerobius fijiensis DSM 17918]|uniref:Penicillin-binding protein 2 n=1 Tax=Caldanaerobius fijiensis DSM 17918 TaxID=1121256 RepID=A0A1M4YA06_9THEO|nr:penicillin-binding protein 2 [Caldanaerobius fijiensis]SHF02469.1 penicillin-binding protein 2 [Caldanaerobius fijiensis DSM 17918]
MDEKKIKSRLKVFIAIIIIIFAVLSAQLINLQIINGSIYKQWADQMKIRSIPIPAPRGNILDRNGVVIANNRPAYTVELVRTNIKDQDLNKVILKLMRILVANNQQFVDNFPLKVNPIRYDFSYGDANVSKNILLQREQAWKKANNLPDDISAKDAFEKLKKDNKIDEKLSDEDARNILVVREEMKKQGYMSYNPVKIASDIDAKTLAQISERYDQLPGVVITIEPIRQYPYKNVGSNFIGYMSRLQPEDIKNIASDPRYSLNDLIGRDGIERLFEKELKGTNGAQQVEVDALGRMIKVLGEKPPKPGNKVYLSIDMKLQQKAEEALKDVMSKIQNGDGYQKFPANIGAAVAVDVNTGDVLAMASIPNFDPNMFAKGTPLTKSQSNYMWPNVTNAMTPQPSYDYARLGTAPPGSTFKMIVGTGALMDHVITPTDQVYCSGVYTYPGSGNPKCWAPHGWNNIIEALKVSCDVFFYDTGRKLGIDNIDKWARAFGLGQPTGIELPESKGQVAGPSQYKQDVILYRVNYYLNQKVIDKEQYNVISKMIIEGEDSDNIIFKKLKDAGIPDKLQYKFWQIIKDSQWRLGQTLSASIGQESTTVTPLQMANYIATLVNGGIRYKLHLIDRVETYDGKLVSINKPAIVEKLNLKPEVINVIKQGMLGVTEEGGTASGAFIDAPYKVGGKTGTAETIGHANYAWFVGFAPFDKPKIAVAVVIYQGGHGSYAAPVARAIMDQYLGYNK